MARSQASLQVAPLCSRRRPAPQLPQALGWQGASLGLDPFLEAQKCVCGCAPGLALKPRSLGEKKGTPPRPAPPSASLFQEPEDPPPMAAWGPQNWEQRWDSPSKLGLSGLPSTQVPALIFCVVPGTWRGCSFPCSRVPVYLISDLRPPLPSDHTAPRPRHGRVPVGSWAWMLGPPVAHLLPDPRPGCPHPPKPAWPQPPIHPDTRVRVSRKRRAGRTWTDRGSL